MCWCQSPLESLHWRWRCSGCTCSVVGADSIRNPLAGLFLALSFRHQRSADVAKRSDDVAAIVAGVTLVDVDGRNAMHRIGVDAEVDWIVGRHFGAAVFRERGVLHRANFLGATAADR